MDTLGTPCRSSVLRLNDRLFVRAIFRCTIDRNCFCELHFWASFYIRSALLLARNQTLVLARSTMLHPLAGGAAGKNVTTTAAYPHQRKTSVTLNVERGRAYDRVIAVGRIITYATVTRPVLVITYSGHYAIRERYRIMLSRYATLHDAKVAQAPYVALCGIVVTRARHAVSRDIEF